MLSVNFVTNHGNRAIVLQTNYFSNEQGSCSHQFSKCSVPPKARALRVMEINNKEIYLKYKNNF